MSKQEPNDDLEDQDTGETRVADAVTIFWMISVMQALLFELATVGAKWYYQFHPEATRVGTLAKLLYLSAALGGSISLLLLPIVFRIRRVPPPRGVTVFAIVIGALPMVTMLLGFSID